MDTRRSTSFVIMRASLGPISLALRAVSNIEILTIPYQAKRPNAICERFLLSVRRECLDHIVILYEKQLHRVLRAYIEYFNRARPHQGIQQQVPQREVTSVPPDQRSNRIISVLILGGLHHAYRRVAGAPQQRSRNTSRVCVLSITLFLACLKAPSCQLPPHESQNTRKLR